MTQFQSLAPEKYQFGGKEELISDLLHCHRDGCHPHESPLPGVGVVRRRAESPQQGNEARDAADLTHAQKFPRHAETTKAMTIKESTT